MLELVHQWEVSTEVLKFINGGIWGVHQRCVTISTLAPKFISGVGVHQQCQQRVIQRYLSSEWSTSVIREKEYISVVSSRSTSSVCVSQQGAHQRCVGSEYISGNVYQREYISSVWAAVSISAECTQQWLHQPCVSSRSTSAVWVHQPCVSSRSRSAVCTQQWVHQPCASSRNTSAVCTQ